MSVAGQQVINIGLYAMDTTGTRFRPAMVMVNSNFALLSAAAGIPYNAIKFGPKPNDNKGDTFPVVFTKINDNFALQFNALGTPNLQQVISLGGEVGMIIGTGQIIGTGDPGRVAFEKINSNFTYLFATL